MPSLHFSQDSHLDETEATIHYPDFGLTLHYDCLTQRLRLISASPKSRRSEVGPSLDLLYQGQPVVTPGVRLDCRKIVSVFPPTTLGTFQSSDLSYLMHFKTGLTVKFRIQTPELFESFKLRRDHPVSHGEYSPLVKSIEVVAATPSPGAIESLPRFEVLPLAGMRFYPPFEKQASWIQLGSGLQDVLSLLGPPDEITGDIYNFFQYGIDIKVDRTRYCCVQKVILHFNLPGHILFGRYRRCWFDIVPGGTDRRGAKARPTSDETSSLKSVNNMTKLQGLVEMFGDPGQPLVVNSPHIPVVQYFYTFSKGLVFELTPSGTIASVEIRGKD